MLAICVADSFEMLGTVSKLKRTQPFLLRLRTNFGRPITQAANAFAPTTVAISTKAALLQVSSSSVGTAVTQLRRTPSAIFGAVAVEGAPVGQMASSSGSGSLPVVCKRWEC